MEGHQYGIRPTHCHLSHWDMDMEQSKARERGESKRVTLSGKSSFCRSRRVKKEVSKLNKLIQDVLWTNKNLIYLKERDCGKYIRGKDASNENIKE